MEDKAFRPERRPINPQEIQAQLNKMTEIDKDQNYAPPVPQFPEGVVKGQVPTDFLSRMEETTNQALPESSTGTMHARMMGVNVDNRLQSVLQQIRQSTTNFEEIILPSLGRFYNGTDVPAINGKLHVRPMTGSEEEILATQRFVKKGQAVNMIFSRCLQEKFDVDKLLVVDRTLLLIYLRGISYTPNYDVEFKCPECDHKFEDTIDLDALDVNRCPDDFGPNSLKGKLPTTGLIFSYHLATGEDDRKIQEYRENKNRLRKQFDTSNRSDDSLLYRSALLIDEIAELTETDKIVQVLRNLPINDVGYLRNLISFPPFGVDTNVPIHCPNCPAEFEVDLPIEANFFFPRAKPKMKEENQ